MSNNKRETLKLIGKAWVAPTIITSSIPAHAQTTGDVRCSLLVPPPNCSPQAASSAHDGIGDIGEFFAIKIFFGFYSHERYYVSFGLVDEATFPYDSVQTPRYDYTCGANGIFNNTFSYNGYRYDFSGQITQHDQYLDVFYGRFSVRATHPDSTTSEVNHDVQIFTGCV